MSRTRAQIRQLVGRESGLLFFAGTADAGGSTTTLVDAALKRYFSDRLNGHWIYLSSGTPTFTDLHITDFDQTTFKATFAPTLGAAPDALTYEVLPFSPTDIHNAITDKLNLAYIEGRLIRPLILRGMTTGSPLYNSGFDYWTSTSTVDGWEKNDSATLTKEIWTANTARSWQSLKVSGAIDYVKQSEPWKRWLWDFKGYKLTLYCWVNTAAASNARINLNNGSNNYSSYHSGSGDWELLSVAVNTATTDTNLEIRLDNAKTNASYFSDPWIEGGPPVNEYPIPLALLPDGPDKVLINPSDREDQRIGKDRPWYDFVYHQQVNPDPATTAVGLLQFDRQPPPGMKMVLHGRAPLTLPSSDTSTVEVTEPESYYIAKGAALELLKRTQQFVNRSLQAIIQLRINQLETDIERLRRTITSDKDVASLPLRW